MTVERDGHFTWEEDQIFDGIRQDATESVRRYRVVKNFNFRNIGAITKDLGLRKIHQTAIDSTFVSKAALDCHFNNRTQKLVLIQGASAATKLYVWSASTGEFGSSLATLANVDHPSMVMFADKLHILDGTTLTTMDNAETIATPGEATYSNPSTMGVVYANRLIVSGNPSYPFSFFPSGLRDSSTWDVDLSVDVTGLRGEEIRCLGICGHYMIVGGPKFTRAYYLGTASPGDWDWDEISSEIGPINHASYKSVSRNGQNLGFFWSEEGPMVLSQNGEGLPRLYPLWKPIDKMVRGVTHQGMPALTVAQYGKVTSEYVPELNELRFAVVETLTTTPTEPNCIMAVDLDSVIDYVADSRNRWPKWRMRNNDNSPLQCQRIFSCRVDPKTGFPSITSGQNRCMAVAAGQVYEMDARGTYTDAPNGAAIPALVRKDGYDGREDGIREHSKSVQRLHIRTNQSGAFTLYSRLYTDGGQQSSVTEIDLGSGLELWSADTTDGTWGNGSVWNEGEFIVQRGGFSGVGKKFDLEVYDSGNVLEELQINSWSLSGMLEDRR